MNFYIGVTDKKWFSFLREKNADEVNFWRPGGRSPFKALSQGDLFLFKLHSPDDYIVGGGIFISYSALPLSLARDAFTTNNGVGSLQEFVKSINKYTTNDLNKYQDSTIGCIILSNVFYLDEVDWIPKPENWSNSIVQGKTYSTDEIVGQKIYTQAQTAIWANTTQLIRQVAEPSGANQYGKPLVIQPRLGQGAFKILTVEAYQRRCAITGEKTLPVLEAAHIKPYSEDGPHQVANGILLRRDYHTLFDRGYLTIDRDFKIVVSQRIKHDFGNGKEYYAKHGEILGNLPQTMENLPSKDFLSWHNDHVYLG